MGSALTKCFIEVVLPVLLPLAMVCFIMFLSKRQFSLPERRKHFRDGHLFFYAAMIVIVTMFDERLQHMVFNGGSMGALLLVGFTGLIGYVLATRYKLQEFIRISNDTQDRIGRVSIIVSVAAILANGFFNIVEANSK